MRSAVLDAEARAFDEIDWRVHDRTHVEIAIDYPLRRAPREQTWEAYFFVPESFRLHEDTYDKRAIHDDLLSYVRYAVPVVSFHDLASTASGSALARVRSALAAASARDPRDARATEVAAAIRELRLFACLARASARAATRAWSDRADLREGARFAASCAALASAFRVVLAEAQSTELADEVRVAARWTDEDVSLLLESSCASLGLALERRGADAADVASVLAAHAVREARHRRSRGYDSVGSAAAEPCWTEHFEFRRHVLKRFTASVLWLSLDARRAAPWVAHALYALAAAAAMAFALTVGARTPAASVSFARDAVIIVFAYAMKDRLKALLQTAFAAWLGRRLPDRKWNIVDRERGRCLGRVDERAVFLPFRRVPPEVLTQRRLTREHALEEQARPERVLWHRKTVVTSAGKRGAGEVDVVDDLSTITEICRLDVHRWLQHTDDPSGTTTFADPVDARLHEVPARRVYNVNVVYRRSTESASSPWHRIRIVVSRSGIERIDPIS